MRPPISSPGEIHCSFCYKTAGAVGKLFSSPLPSISALASHYQGGTSETNRSDSFTSHICDQCVAVCNSVCNMPSDSRRTTSVQSEAELSDVATTRERILQLEARALLREMSTQSWLQHPLASQLFMTIEDWIRRDRQGQNTDRQLTEMKRVASIMFNS